PIGYNNRLLHIEWKGMALIDEAIPELTFPDLFKRIYGLPTAGWLDVIERGYGYAVPWVLLPLGAFAMGVAAIVVVRDLAAGRGVSAVSNLLCVSVLGFLSLKTSP